MQHYLLHNAGPQFTKLHDCYFCQSVHFGHAFSWLFGWWVGLSLPEVCYLVLTSTLLSPLAAFILSVAENLTIEQRMEQPESDEEQLGPTRRAADSVFEPLPKNPEEEKTPQQKHLEKLLELGYQASLMNGGKSINIEYVPPRERIWNQFFTGKPDPNVPGLKELWGEVEKELEELPQECPKCERNATIAKYRDRAIALINAYLKNSGSDDGEGS